MIHPPPVCIPILYVRGQIDAARKALVRGDIAGSHKGVEKALSSLVVVLTRNTVAGITEIASPKPKR